MRKPLEYYEAHWGLQNCEPLTQTPRGHLFKAQKNETPAVLKIYTDTGAEHERRGAVFLKDCPSTIAVNILEHDDNAVLMEYLPSGDLRQWVQEGRDDQATKTIADMAVKVSKVPVPDNHTFPDLKRWFQALFDVAENKNTAHQLSFSKAAETAKDLLADNIPPVLLHGDLHQDNIMLDAGNKPKMIDAKGLIEDPAYEVANAMRNPYIDGLVTKDRILRQAEILSDVMTIDKARILAFGFVHAWLSCAWAVRDGFPLKTDSLQSARLFDEIVK